MNWSAIRSKPWWSEVLAAAVATLISLPVLSWPFAHDQSIFAAIAREMTEGAVLYRDVWEHKPPGVFCTYALAFLLIHDDLWAVHVMEILAVAMAAAGLARLGRERLGSRTAGFVSAAAMALLYLPWRGNTAQPEFFALPFVVWSFALSPRAGDPGPPEPSCFWSGVLCSCAILYKTPFLFFALAAVTDRLAIDVRQPGWKAKLRPTVATLAGMALLPILVVLYCLLRGALSAFLDANLHFPAMYAAPSMGRSLADHREAFHWTAWLVPPAGLLLLLLGLLRGFQARPRETLRWVGFFAAGWAAVVLQGKYWPYHHLAMLAGIAAGFGLPFLRDPANEATPSRARRVASRVVISVATVLAAGTAWSYGADARREWREWNGLATRDLESRAEGPRTGSEDERQAARVLRDLTRPGEKVFVWGDKPILYVLADRRLAGPYPHLLPVLGWFLGPEAKPRLDTLIERVGQERPRWIVVTPGRLWWYGNHEPREIITEWPNLKRFLGDCYALQFRSGEYEFWKRQE
jgi:4-amino-4-deoxy-L-arabinose transferase-like glycosyltransferase